VRDNDGMHDPKLLFRRVVPEFEGLRLGDRRLDARVLQSVEALARDPSASILAAARSTAEAEAMYRLLRNRRVSMAAMLEPHMTHAAARCVTVAKVLVVHDTSQFKFSGEEREGLGRLSVNSHQGFLFHASLAVEAGTRQPLGLVASTVWVRDMNRTAVVQGRNGPRKKSGPEYARTASKESDRWGQQIQASARRLAAARKVVHVADREADIYALLALLRDRGDCFVIRLARDKKARLHENAEPESIIDIASRATGCVQVEVPIAARAATTVPRQQKTFAARAARLAKLEFAAVTAEIVRPSYVADTSPSLPINVVHVRELDCPSDQEPVEWFLLTSEPIDTEEAVREVVDIYRARWLIEEFFKALKTGCGMEQRELESLQTLTNALALCIPIAYQLLALRHLARSAPSAPAHHLLSAAQISILQAKARLPREPTAQQALEAVAYLGSHFLPFAKKMPGWRVMARGMERLLDLEEGWLVRQAEETIKR